MEGLNRDLWDLGIFGIIGVGFRYGDCVTFQLSVKERFDSPECLLTDN